MEESMDYSCGKRKRESLTATTNLVLQFPPHRDKLYKWMEYQERFFRRKEDLLHELGIPCNNLEAGLVVELCLQDSDESALLEKIRKAARIFFMDEIELYFAEGGYWGPFSPINELESLSAIYSALTTLFTGSSIDSFLMRCKNLVLYEIHLLAQKNAHIYSDIRPYEEPDLSPSCDRLMAWLRSKNVISNLIIANVSEGGRGLIASKDIAVGDLVLEIPLSLVIHDQLPKSTIPEYKRLRSDEMMLVRLLVWIMEEKVKLDDSDFNLYFGTLPEELNTGLYFSEDALNAAHGTWLYEEISYAKSRMKLQFDNIICKVDPKISPESYKWAYALWSSHGINALQSSGKQKRCLVPFAGFFNHSLFPHVLDCEWGEKSLKFIASRPCKKSEQCYLSYGNLSGLKLAADYGFLPKGKNYFDVITLDPFLCNDRFEEYGSKRDLWMRHMVRGRLGDDQVDCLPSTIRDHFRFLFIATYGYHDLQMLAERAGIETLRKHLSARLEELELTHETERRKSKQNWEKPPWDVKLALEYYTINIKIYGHAISACNRLI